MEKDKEINTAIINNNNNNNNNKQIENIKNMQLIESKDNIVQFTETNPNLHPEIKENLSISLSKLISNEQILQQKQKQELKVIKLHTTSLLASPHQPFAGKGQLFADKCQLFADKGQQLQLPSINNNYFESSPQNDINTQLITAMEEMKALEGKTTNQNAIIRRNAIKALAQIRSVIETLQSRLKKEEEEEKIIN